MRQKDSYKTTFGTPSSNTMRTSNIRDSLQQQQNAKKFTDNNSISGCSLPHNVHISMFSSLAYCSSGIIWIFLFKSGFTRSHCLGRHKTKERDYRKDRDTKLFCTKGEGGWRESPLHRAEVTGGVGREWLAGQREGGDGEVREARDWETKTQNGERNTAHHRGLYHSLWGRRSWGCTAYACTDRPKKPLKGTQEWELFWLRFWILYYFIVSYVQILRFCKKNFFDQATIGGDTIIPLSLRISRIEFSLVWD
jgi:hypothetical protein